MFNNPRTIAYLLVFLMLSGCASSKMGAPNHGKNKAEIVLKPGEFRIVKAVRGEASCPFLFWIDIPSAIESKAGIDMPLITFALGNSNLRELAMRDLHSKHDLLGKPQILHNFIEEWTIANYLGIFAVVKVSISAEVIEFTEDKEI